MPPFSSRSVQMGASSLLGWPSLKTFQLVSACFEMSNFPSLREPENRSRLDHPKKHQGTRPGIGIGTNVPLLLTLPENLVQPPQGTPLTILYTFVLFSFGSPLKTSSEKMRRGIASIFSEGLDMALQDPIGAASMGSGCLLASLSRMLVRSLSRTKSRTISRIWLIFLTS